MKTLYMASNCSSTMKQWKYLTLFKVDNAIYADHPFILFYNL